MTDTDRTETLTAVIHRLQEVINQLQGEMAWMRDESIKKDGKIELLEKQLHDKDKRLETLYRKLGGHKAIQKTIGGQIEALQMELSRLQTILDDD